MDKEKKPDRCKFSDKLKIAVVIDVLKEQKRLVSLTVVNLNSSEYVVIMDNDVILIQPDNPRPNAYKKG